MNKLLVIGKNSFYYNEVKKLLTNEFEIFEISHLQIDSFNENIVFDNIVIFSRIRDLNLLNKINENFKFKKITLLSSVVISLDSSFRYYSYYKEKLLVENWFNKIFKNNGLIIRSGTIEGTSILYSKKSDFLDVLTSNPSGLKILRLYIDKINLPNIIYRVIYRIKFGYILLRPFDLIYKFYNKKLYGYTYGVYDIIFKKQL